VRAKLVDQADAAVGIAKRQQILAQDADAHLRSIRLGKLGIEQNRQPVAAHQVAHRRARTDADEQLLSFAR